MAVKNRFLDRPFLLELFAFTNLAFLAVDIYVAHMINNFAHKAEWIPFVFSLLAPVLLIPTLVKPVGAAPLPGFIVGVGSILVGLLGFYYHLESQFFHSLSIESLVYTAPFVAPLAYTGVGFLVLLNRMVEPDTQEWSRWVALLAMGGFVGNFLLSVCDHAQNGFFHAEEWVPVISSAFAVAFLAVLCFGPRDRGFCRWCLWVMALQLLVGVVGFYYHFSANLEGVADSAWDNFIYGAPAFAPLLFVNLSLLAALGIWQMLSLEE